MIEPKYFQLSVNSDQEFFRPEIEYVCQFLERAHGLHLSSSMGPVLHYGTNPPDGAVHVPAVFFPDGVKVSHEGLFPDRAAISKMFDQASPPFLFPPNKTIGQSPFNSELSYDALGLIFLLLSRIEERDPPSTDRYGRFPFAESYFNHMGGVHQPWADHAARDITAKLLSSDTPPNRTVYSVVLTHDVDRLKGYHKVHFPLRYALGDLVKRGSVKQAVKTLKMGYLSGEPWTSIRNIMELSEQKKLISRFFFMAPSQLVEDSTYARTMVPLLKKVVANIAERGHLIGFHPGYNTSSDSMLWMSQKNALEEILDRRLTEGRQHVLRYDIATTPKIWSDAGMDVDYSMAFPEVAGFRTGTCRAYAAYDLKNRAVLSVDLVATSITDFGLVGEKYQNLSVDEAIKACSPIVQACQNFGGKLCVLFHTSNQDGRQTSFYETLVEEFL